MLIYCSQLYFYRPQTKLREGTLSQVSVPDTHCCLSLPTYRWQAGGTHPTGILSCFSQLVYLYFAFLHLSVILFAGGGVYNPWADTLPPPPPMATEAGSTLPTGMHSCFVDMFVQTKLIATCLLTSVHTVKLRL